jgi:sec-independent protein translocase protein TatA
MGDMPDLGIGEIAIIALVIFALFGYKRLPDAARSLGRSMRVFRAETRGLKDDDVRGKAEARVTTRGPLGDETASEPASNQAKTSGATSGATSAAASGSTTDADATPAPTVIDAEVAEPAKQQAAGS